MERLQELKNEVVAQEMRLKSLQLQHQQQCATTTSNSSSGSTERETLNALIFLKEKELALALMKVAELTGQLERLKRSEVKSESLPRTGKRNATSSVVPAVRNTSERRQGLDARASSNQADDLNGNETSANADAMRPSRSFDASLLTPRRSASRDRFFSSFSDASSADPSSSFGSCSSSSSGNAVATSSVAPYASSEIKTNPALNVSRDEKELSKLRHSTSSSIMSRFAPKPYSNRSMSVDCGALRRPLLQNVQIHSQDDQVVPPVRNDPVPNSGLISKTPKVCLLPKSASFHYGYNEKENALIKAKRSDSQYGNIKTTTSQNFLLPNHLPSSSIRFSKPKLTPKPVHLLKDCKHTSAAFIPSNQHNNNNNNINNTNNTNNNTTNNNNINHSYPNNVSSFVESQNKSLGILTNVLRDDLLNQPESFYDNPIVCNTLTITLSQAANSRDLLDPTSEHPLTSQSNVALVSENTDERYDDAEIFKKRGVRELSKMFSQLPKDSLVNATNNKDGTYRHTSSCIEKSDVVKLSETLVSATAASQECLASANEKESGSTQGIDISANAVSSALSILLSSTSASNASRHTTASRPNRLFGYSSSYSRPKFSFVPSDQKDGSSRQEIDVEHVPTEDVPRAAVKAPTIYSLFSPPPKAKLSTGANASPEKYPRNTYDCINSFNNLNTEPKTATKKNIYLPRLSYITLSSDLTRNPEENAVPKVKTRKRVTIDPSFLFLSAVVEGELDIIKSVVAQVPNPDLSNDNGMTSLHMAVCNDHVEVVKFLLDYGCNVNAPNCESWTPLHYAALGNKKEIMELLLCSGACVFALTASDHETPIQKCQSKAPCYEECIKVLDDFGNQLGSVNDGIVYSMADYEAECDNECSLKEGESIRVLRRGDEVESEWWWASKSSGSGSSEGYVPRSILSLHPKRPRMWRSK